MISFIKKFYDFLKVKKKYWLLPIFFVLVLIGIIIILGKGAVIIPFVYTIF